MSLSDLLRLPGTLLGSSSDLPSQRPLPGSRPGTAPGGQVPHELIAQGRYCLLLSRENNDSVDDAILAAAWKALEEGMALVPAGKVAVGAAWDGETGFGADPFSESGRAVAVPTLYIDRCAVTNAEFARFVAAGGYNQMELWPAEIWPSVLQFVDSTGLVGPRFWSKGKPPRGKEDHPVVGISWFEANAYARWVGKRLPKSAEWERAASWSAGLNGRGGECRYPWGNAFDPSRANTWVGGPGTTVKVDEYYSGCTPNGVYQLIGNVWEWVASRYQWHDTYQRRSGQEQADSQQPMGEIRGGAFDTYFESQATCQFRTGQPLLYRGRNVGFRCCVSDEDLRRPPAPSAFLETDNGWTTKG